jgi:DnaJ-domain-containing protein 1
MAPYIDPYTQLGLAPGADEHAIRQAFRRLAFELHPDRNADPAATESFVRLRKAYETLLDPAYHEAVEAEAVAETVLRAAAEAAKTRPVRERASARFVLAAGPRGLAPAVAGRVAVVCVVAAVLAVTLAVLAEAVFALAGAACLIAAAAAWLTRRRPAAVRLYGSGFEDDRWPEAGRIGWGDVCALDPDYAAGFLDLALSEAAAARLERLPTRPREALVWQGSQPFYRLPLGATVREVVPAVEGRTGVHAR